MPAPLRKAAEMKTHFFPALVRMLTEVEQDQEVWINSTEEEEISATGPAYTAMDAIKRLGLDLGEKTTVAVAQPLVAECIAQEGWQEKQAGFVLMGLISESCCETFRKSVGDVMTGACAGIAD